MLFDCFHVLVFFSFFWISRLASIFALLRVFFLHFCRHFPRLLPLFFLLMENILPRLSLLVLIQIITVSNVQNYSKLHCLYHHPLSKCYSLLVGDCHRKDLRLSFQLCQHFLFFCSSSRLVLLCCFFISRPYRTLYLVFFLLLCLCFLFLQFKN